MSEINSIDINVPNSEILDLAKELKIDSAILIQEYHTHLIEACTSKYNCEVTINNDKTNVDFKKNIKPSIKARIRQEVFEYIPILYNEFKEIKRN